MVTKRTKLKMHPEIKEFLDRIGAKDTGKTGKYGIPIWEATKRYNEAIIGKCETKSFAFHERR